MIRNKKIPITVHSWGGGGAGGGGARGGGVK